MSIVKVLDRGQIVIPHEIRQRMDLRKGRRLFLDFSESEMTIKLRPAGENAEITLRGLLRDTDVLEMRNRERQKEISKDERRSRA